MECLMRIFAALVLLALVLVAVAPAMALPVTGKILDGSVPRPVILVDARLYRPGEAEDMARPSLACLSGSRSRFVISDGDTPVLDLSLLPTMRTENLLSLRVETAGEPGQLLLLRPESTQTVVLPGADRRLLDVSLTVLEDRAALDRVLARREGTR